MFLYFTNENPDPEKLGLQYAFEGKPRARKCRTGPNGIAGTVFADPSVEMPDIGYYKDRQTWRMVPGSDAWVGFYNDKDKRPTPENLARKVQLNGYEFELGDGNKWACPVARDYASEDTGDGESIVTTTGLPTCADLDEDGNWVDGEVVDKYKALWEVANRWFDEFEKTLPVDKDEPDIGENPIKGDEFTVPDENEGCTIALQANYRVGRTEVAVLKLLDDNTRGLIFMAMVALPKYWDLKKKEVETIEIGSDGAVEDYQDTAPAFQTS